MERASSSPPPPVETARRRPPEELKLRRRTLETVLEQCQRALEMMREANLGEEAAEGASSKEMKEEGGGNGNGNGNGGEDEGAPPPSEADDNVDELCDLLKSRVQSPEFLEKLDTLRKSVYQHGAVDEMVSWDIISAADIWDDKSINVSDDSEDGYVLVKQEDIVDGITCFVAAYLLSLKETTDLTTNQLQQAPSKTSSAFLCPEKFHNFQLQVCPPRSPPRSYSRLYENLVASSFRRLSADTGITDSSVIFVVW